jgi:Arc/MetJ-type ribon-helix-helix transcriptional regulator
MAKISVDVPDKLKKRIEETAENKDYKSSSEYIREALRNQLEKDEEVDAELLYRYMKLEKGEEGLEKASSIDEVRKRING